MPHLIIGHTTHDSTTIWVRGSRRWPVAFVDLLDMNDQAVGRTRVVELEESEFHTGITRIRGLAADTRYRAKVAFGKTKRTPRAERVREGYTEGVISTFSAPGSSRKFSFLLGSCNLHSLGIIEKPDRAWSRISEVAADRGARFMLHCGDQIYADIPLGPFKSLSHYRDKYLDAWDDCRPARRVLTELPHYMVLDDHEVDNNWNSDERKGDENALRNIALKVYWEFQHCHNPPSGSGDFRYWYTFDHGTARFFVMDTRTERLPAEGEMIGPGQLRALKRWLLDNRNRLKFVVTSVPFVGEVKSPKADKWCDPAYAGQRESILDHLRTHRIGKLTFLTGDMHTSYHATMTITDPNGPGLVVHELMSSPINQVTPNTSIRRHYRSPFTWRTPSGLSVRSEIDSNSFYGDHSNVMAVEVDGNRVRYRIYRTSKRERVARSGSFVP